MFRPGLYASVLTFVVTGLFGVIWGVYLKLTYFAGLSPLLNQFLFFVAPCYLITSGVFILLSSCVAFCDLNRNNTFELLSVKYLVAMVFFAEIMFLLGVYQVGVELNHKLTPALNSTMSFYEINSTDSNSGVTDAWNLLQTKFSCCGLVNASDWAAAGVPRPEVCCGDQETCRGCLDPLKQSIYDEVLGVAILATVKGVAILGTIGSLTVNYPGYGSFDLRS